MSNEPVPATPLPVCTCGHEFSETKMFHLGKCPRGHFPNPVTEPVPVKPLTVVLAERITASQRQYEKMAADCWTAFDVTGAVRWRGMAEGLALALDHLLDVMKET